jgi:hypothetical protein
LKVQRDTLAKEVDRITKDAIKAWGAYESVLERNTEILEDRDNWKALAGKLRKGLVDLLLWYAGNQSLPDACKEAEKLVAETAALREDNG